MVRWNVEVRDGSKQTMSLGFCQVTRNPDNSEGAPVPVDGDITLIAPGTKYAIPPGGIERIEAIDDDAFRFVTKSGSFIGVPTLGSVSRLVVSGYVDSTLVTYGIDQIVSAERIADDA